MSEVVACGCSIKRRSEKSHEIDIYHKQGLKCELRSGL